MAKPVSGKAAFSEPGDMPARPRDEFESKSLDSFAANMCDGVFNGVGCVNQAQNIVISLAVILFLIVSALAEKINLTAGVIGHEGSTVVVILNGLRLLRFRGE